jgi:hypothetical protein
VVAAGPIDGILRSAALSECFGLPLLVFRHHDGRYTARAALVRMP